MNIPYIHLPNGSPTNDCSPFMSKEDWSRHGFTDVMLERGNWFLSLHPEDVKAFGKIGDGNEGSVA